jgi:hypothetical protein
MAVLPFLMHEARMCHGEVFQQHILKCAILLPYFYFSFRPLLVFTIFDARKHLRLMFYRESASCFLFKKLLKLVS